MIPHGLACQSGLRVGDRILEVNSIDLRHATHQEAVRALLANKQEIRMLVRRDPSPPGMQVGKSIEINIRILIFASELTLSDLTFPDEVLHICIVAGNCHPQAAG